jgi:putative tryptophan/tyrosine transport system substrate-binding protein
MPFARLRRREFITTLGGAMAWPLVGRSQPTGRVYRVGVLRATAPEDQIRLIPALREAGYVQGRNLELDLKYASGDLSLLPALARELVQSRSDVILAVGSPATRAARDATDTIPIVMFGNFDPVALRFVASLARPGGNVTGVLISSEGTHAAKKLELLKEAVPQSRRIAMLVPDDPSIGRQVQEVRDAAASLGIELVVVEVQGNQYAKAFETMVASRPDALFVAAHNYFVIDRKPIIELAAKHRLPAIYEWADQVRDGGLMAYGTSLYGLNQRLATYIDRIFDGAKPGDLPVELPTKLELAINLATARAIGLTIPGPLLSRADELIE